MQDLKPCLIFFKFQETSVQMFDTGSSPLIVRKRNHFCS